MACVLESAKNATAHLRNLLPPTVTTNSSSVCRGLRSSLQVASQVKPQINKFLQKVITTHHFCDIEPLTGSDWHLPTLSSCKVNPCVVR